MSLNSTGPISLGGSTSGQSVEVELGETGTQPISMGDANFRGLLGVLSGPISLDNAHGKSLFAGTLQTTITQPSNAYGNTYAGFGFSNAVSADGLTMVVGGPNDYPFGYGGNGYPVTLGAAWIFTRTDTTTTTWTQQAKLLGSGGIGAITSSQYSTGFNVLIGWTVAISDDGNTVAIGAPSRITNPPPSQGSYSCGGVWIYVRSGTTWTQQAGPLIYNNSSVNGELGLGYSLAMSGDGNTVAAGQPNAGNSGTQGGVAVFVRSGTSWSLQSGLLQGSDSTATSGTQMGWSVALSKDGNTLAFGGPGDNTNSSTGIPVGATWVFTRSGTSWSQQGSKRVGTSGSPSMQYPATAQGYAVALSGDGNTLATSDPTDNSWTGATWIFTRSGTTWTQQGSKIVATGGSTKSQSLGQGSALALNYVGSLLAISAYGDNSPTDATSSYGALWIFKSTPGAGTFSQIGSKITGNSIQGLSLGQSISIANSVGNVVVSGGGAGAEFNNSSYSTVADQQVLVYR